MKTKSEIDENGTCSSWSEIIFGVLQSCILGPLLFNVFLYDFFQFSPISILPSTQTITIPTQLTQILIRYYTIQKKSQILYSKGLSKVFWRQTRKSLIFLRTQHKKLKLTSVEWPSPTVNVKNLWVSTLITSWHLSPM